MKQIYKNVFEKMKRAACRLSLVACCSIFLLSCEKVKDWRDPTDGVPPEKLSNVTVKNINGGAWVYYSLPTDNDLLGVRAEYAFEEGEELQSVFSSSFNDSVLIEGYFNTDEHTVNLYVIDKSRNESEPAQAVIKPLTPPVELLRRSLKVYTTYGGIYSEWNNEYGNDVAITVSLKDSVGDYVAHEVCYTKAKEGKYTFRNMKNVTQDIRIEIRDKWEHYSTALDTTLTPLFEEEIFGRDPNTSANIWQLLGYDDGTYLNRGDVSTNPNNPFWRIYDGAVFQNSTWWMTVENIVLSDYISWPDNLYQVLPNYFTIDMSKKASYSRLRYWMRSRTPYYSASTMVDFEVWGTNEPKALNTIGDGSREDNLKYWTQWPEVGGTDEWKNDWVKLADCGLRFPSGANPYITDPVLTAEDNEFIAAGFGFDTDPIHASEAFRYLRFVVKRYNTPVRTQLQITELKLWGAYSEE